MLAFGRIWLASGLVSDLVPALVSGRQISARTEIFMARFSILRQPEQKSHKSAFRHLSKRRMLPHEASADSLSENCALSTSKIIELFSALESRAREFGISRTRAQ